MEGTNGRRTLSDGFKVGRSTSGPIRPLIAACGALLTCHLGFFLLTSDKHVVTCRSRGDVQIAG